MQLFLLSEFLYSKFFYFNNFLQDFNKKKPLWSLFYYIPIFSVSKFYPYAHISSKLM